MKDVSIIVPVYNTEKYLKTCLDSLVNQNYDKDKYEIIAINDCSTDNSLSILNDYRRKYKNIIVYDFKKNHGVSYARNSAIKKSNGEYLMFCDSDDRYDYNAIKTLIDSARKYNADFVMADYFISKGNKNIAVNSSNYFSETIISKKEIISYMTLTSCSKLIKRELFINNKVFYPEDLKKCEELPVIPVLAYKANKAISISHNLYYYVQRSDSASNERYKDIQIDSLSFFDESFNKFVDLLSTENYAHEIEFRAIDHLLYGKCLVMLKSNIERSQIIKYIDNFKEEYPNFIKNKYLKRFSKSKHIFILALNNKMIVIARILAYIHERITG